MSFYFDEILGQLNHFIYTNLQILEKGLWMLTSFHIIDSRVYVLNGFDFNFWWRDSEKQRYADDVTFGLV